MILKKIKPKKINNDIFLWKKVINKNDCQEIINIVENYCDWDEATTFGETKDYRKTKIIHLTSQYGNNSFLYWAHNTIGYAIKRIAEETRSFYMLNEKETSLQIATDEGFQFLKYEKGDYYKTHVDDGDGEKIKRILSVVVYLNNDYKGGETFFPRQKIKVKGNVGDILVFPSNYCYHHSSEEILEGNKYSVVTWFK
jgi:prolyl 4-hydroxylase